MSQGTVPEGFLRTLEMIWLGILITPIGLLFVLWIVVEEGRVSDFSLTDPLMLSLGFVAVTLYGVAQRLHTFLPHNRVKTNVDQLQSIEPARVLPVFVIRLALFEGISLLGLVFALVKESIVLFLPFAFLSLIGLLASRPSERLIRRLAGQPYA